MNNSKGGFIMALNLEVVGSKMGPIEFNYDTDRVILYALGVGQTECH